MLIRVLLVAVGFAAAVTGLVFVYPPAAMVVGGTAVVVLGFAWDDGKKT